MRFEIQATVIKALIEHPRRPNPICLDVSGLLIVPKKKLLPFLDVCIKYRVGTKPGSQKCFIEDNLRSFAGYLNSAVAKNSGEIPESFADWQFLVLQFGLWYISRPESNAKFDQRCLKWQKSFRPWLEFLCEEGWVPLGVTIPNLGLPSETVDLPPTQKNRVLGELPNLEMDDENVSEFIDKTLAGPIFWRSDAEYLDQIETKLRNCDRVLGDTLLDYWVKLVRDYRKGKKLLARLSEDAWLDQEITQWKYDTQRYLASPKSVDGHIWALRCLQQQLQHGTNINCLSISELRQHPALPEGFFKRGDCTPTVALRMSSALSPSQSDHLTARQVFNRFLGVLNSLDFAVALALLIREHPNFNPEALAGARVVDGHNKSHLVISGDDKSLIFSVAKPRARSRKYAVLSHKAGLIFQHLIRATATVRAVLRRANDPRWRYLFLGDVHQGSLGHPAQIQPRLLTGTSKGFSLALLYPELANAGLVAGTVSFTKIRNTQGVIRWFDTGSSQAVAKRLGNSQRTSIEYYLPESLIFAWNERVIRLFQNTLLVLAAREETWMLDVVDMPNLEELNRFIAQLLCDLRPGSSPIADRVHEFFSSDQQNSTASSGPHQANGLLQVRLSSSSLALLLAYRSWAQTQLSSQEQGILDESTGLCPKHFIDLAGMLQAAAQSENIGDKLRESLDVARLRRCYWQAIELVPNFLKKIRGLSISPPVGFSQ